MKEIIQKQLSRNVMVHLYERQAGDKVPEWCKSDVLLMTRERGCKGRLTCVKHGSRDAMIEAFNDIVAETRRRREASGESSWGIKDATAHEIINRVAGAFPGERSARRTAPSRPGVRSARVQAAAQILAKQPLLLDIVERTAKLTAADIEFIHSQWDHIFPPEYVALMTKMHQD